MSYLSLIVLLSTIITACNNTPVPTLTDLAAAVAAKTKITKTSPEDNRPIDELLEPVIFPVYPPNLIAIGSQGALRPARTGNSDHSDNDDTGTDQNCLNDEECDDDNVCTDNTCDPASGCVYTPNTISCDDGNVCTASDTCSMGTCQPGMLLDNCQPCSENGECDDNNACSTDYCNVTADGCGHYPTTCDDSSICTDDTCDPTSGCVFTTVVVCESDGDSCNGVEVCNPKTGTCRSVNSTNCDDGMACTNDFCGGDGCYYEAVADFCCTSDSQCEVVNDVCNGVLFCNTTNGQCEVREDPIVDCDDNNLCTDDNCDPMLGCVHAPHACNNGDSCSMATCDNPRAGCQYSQIEDCCYDDNDCTGDDDNACTNNVCAMGTGGYKVCQNIFDETNPCSDNSVCTRDVCVAFSGECESTVIDCEPIPGLCVDTVCDPIAGCIADLDNHVGAFCEDGEYCTLVSFCTDLGTCEGTPREGCCSGNDACEDSDPCTADSCDTSTGNCTNEFITGCCDNEDGEEGVNICADENVCTFDTCVSEQGCSHEFNPDCCSLEDVCSDDNKCTDDICSIDDNHLVCTHTFIFECCDTDTCNDYNSCTSDLCTDGIGCYYQDDPNNPDCCPEDTECCNTNEECIDDGDLCNGTKSCVNRRCVESDPVVCSDDNNKCTDASCDPATGSCSNDPITCFDNTNCTTDDCDPATGCVFMPVGECCTQAIDCDDLNDCTSEICAAGGFCQYNGLNDNTCEDGNNCTIGDICVDRDCTSGALIECVDNNNCTIDSCNPDGSCSYEFKNNCCGNEIIEDYPTTVPIDEACDDGNSISVDGCSDTCQIEIRRAFLTRSIYSSDLRSFANSDPFCEDISDGVSAADCLCQSAANSSGLKCPAGDAYCWKAWISGDPGSNSAPADRFNMRFSGANTIPIYQVDTSGVADPGAPIATGGWADLIVCDELGGNCLDDGGIGPQYWRDETGVRTVGTLQAFTNVEADGTASSVNACNNWTEDMNPDTLGKAGNVAIRDSSWTNPMDPMATTPCHFGIFPGKLYCFEDF